jgi:pyridoxamine 5'-phosphate oxidase
VADQVSYYEDPKEIEKKIWELLTQAVTNRTSNFRTPVFICGNAENIDGRVVVLRKADQQNNFVQFHSDLRSSKIPKVKSNPNCALLFYDKEEKIQVRIKSICTIHQNDDVTKEAWSKTQHISRKCYLVKDGPGTLSETPTSGLEKKYDNFDYTKEESESGYKNFCVVRCKIKSIEWLYLAAKGHRRGIFDLENSKKFTWLVP